MAMAIISESSLALILVLSAVVTCNGAPLPQADQTIFSVMNFGAKPNSELISTQAFMRAWRAACDFNGRARVFVPPGVYTLGETSFAGPCKGTHPIILQIAGTLKAVPDVSEYSNFAWISFDSINGVIITGGGTLDAQGKSVWQFNDCKTNPDCVHLPATLHFNGIENGKVMRLNLINSMGFHLHITNSYLVRFHGLTIDAPEDSPNTDGIHISKSNTIKLSRSVIRTGDDCVSFGQGTNNVTVNKVTCGPGHGISVGSLGKLPGELEVRGLIVKNCTLKGTTNGIRIKTFAGAIPNRAFGMMFSDIVMENVKNPIVIDQSYGDKSTEPSQVKISDVIYQNIRGTTTSDIAVHLVCSSKLPCQNVRLTNINLKHIANTPITSQCENANVGYTGLQIPPPCHRLSS
ncbi:exopolygalacturonase-like [Lycium barbarum]|uniref:exopolygalacturonase-like n=1 Tax=Lycium barbarum TaxID=112863 RepID=UPI00293EC061|nr:exopolygalacturonase-like [Lycium barbarum]